MTVDESTQKPFYYNSETKETSWTAPPGFTPPPAGSSPSPPQPPAPPASQTNPVHQGQPETIAYASPVAAAAGNPWNQTQDAQGRTYWYNTETKATSWTDPHSQSAAQPTIAQGGPPMQQNPWNTAQDAQGRTYWYNTQTKATSWTDPNATPIQLNVNPQQLTTSDARVLPLDHLPFAGVQCHACQRIVTTQVELTWGSAACAVCCIGFWCFFPCMCVPCCVDTMQDAAHHCPYCRALIKTVPGRVL
jgi:hypothetical protein